MRATPETIPDIPAPALSISLEATRAHEQYKKPPYIRDHNVGSAQSGINMKHAIAMHLFVHTIHRR